MVKLCFCVRKLPGLSDEAFRRYWLVQHGPLVRRHAAALGIRRYVQCHTVASGLNAALRESRGAQAPYDGIAEVWWESAEALARATATPEGRKAGEELLEDERNFIDLERSALFLTEEQEIVGD